MTWLFPIGIILLQVCIVCSLTVHILIRRVGSTETRLAWILFIILLPIGGALGYLLVGASFGRGKVRRHAMVRESMPNQLCLRTQDLPDIEPELPRHYQQVFNLAGRLADTDAMSGHELELISTTQEFFNRLILDIDQAATSLHLLTYIFLDDADGQRVCDALIRATQRGVQCRVLVDSMGSKKFRRSQMWTTMQHAGIHLTEALPAHTWAMFWSRLDIRNHRKIIVVDNHIGWVGSQNIASESFGLKPKFAPWVDCMVRLRGPAVHDLQRLFLEDWKLDTDEEFVELLQIAPEVSPNGATAQIFGSGPNFRNEVLQMIFQASIGAAEEELIITTPYFVPDVATAAALRSAALRGVRTCLVVPARNDSRIVALASRGHYATLLQAGVEIYEFNDGLLHAKTMTVDRQLFLVGSANLDRRSLDLNFEISMLGWDNAFASQLRFLQVQYMEQSSQISSTMWDRRPLIRQLANNAAGLLSPLL